MIDITFTPGAAAEKSSREFERAVERAVSAWMGENWWEIQDGAMPGLPELSRKIRLLAADMLAPGHGLFRVICDSDAVGSNWPKSKK